MYRWLHNSNMPAWLRWLLYILLTLTVVYLLGVIAYKMLEALRRFMHWASDKRNWWTFLVCILILLVGSLLVAQFALGLDPVGKTIQAAKDMWQALRNFIANSIS